VYRFFDLADALLVKFGYSRQADFVGTVKEAAVEYREPAPAFLWYLFWALVLLAALMMGPWLMDGADLSNRMQIGLPLALLRSAHGYYVLGGVFFTLAFSVVGIYGLWLNCKQGLLRLWVRVRPRGGDQDRVICLSETEAGGPFPAVLVAAMKTPGGLLRWDRNRFQLIAYPVEYNDALTYDTRRPCWEPRAGEVDPSGFFLQEHERKWALDQENKSIEERLLQTTEAARRERDAAQAEAAAAERRIEKLRQRRFLD